MTTLIKWLEGYTKVYLLLAIVWLASLMLAAYNLAAGSRFTVMTLGWMGMHYVAPAIIWFVVPFWGFLRGLRGLWQKNLRLTLAGFALPAVGAIIFLYGDAPFQWLRFIGERPRYQAAVTQMETKSQMKSDTVRDGSPIIAVFPWEGWAGIWFGIVYDSTDEITKSDSARSQEWQNHPNGRALACTGVIRSFGGHYYFVGGVDC